MFLATAASALQLYGASMERADGSGKPLLLMPPLNTLPDFWPMPIGQSLAAQLSRGQKGKFSLPRKICGTSTRLLHFSVRAELFEIGPQIRSRISVGDRDHHLGSRN